MTENRMGNSQFNRSSRERCWNLTALLVLSFWVAAGTAFAQEPASGSAESTPAAEASPSPETTSTEGSPSVWTRIKNALSNRPELADGESGGIPTEPLEIMLEMGIWIVPFLLASVIALWFSIERLVVLRRGRVIPRPFVERFLQHLSEGKLNKALALELCEENASPVAFIFSHGVRKWGKPSVEVEQAIIDGGERQVSQLRRHLRVINGVATISPLLGLLGTVIGMIQAFNDIARAGSMGNTEQLAVGIAIALLTTAFGLCIAIPALVIYMYLSGRVDALVMEMDLLAQDVVHLISAEGLAESPQSRPPRGRATSRPAPAETKKAV